MSSVFRQHEKREVNLTTQLYSAGCDKATQMRAKSSEIILPAAAVPLQWHSAIQNEVATFYIDILFMFARFGAKVVGKNAKDFKK